MSTSEDSGRSAIVVAALGRYLADRAQGCEQPVAHYARLFPGFEDAIAAELTVASAGAEDESATPAAGQAIGPYHILGELGSGGMGMVLLGEQRAPVRRRVAVKVVKPGMDTRAVLRRFEAERQALASMDHPNIARVFDAGTTDAGRPYFVMDLVEGVPLTDYCDRRRLTVRARLELFLQVCAGVQHAHQRGIVHRDLKPSNVLVAEVDGGPVVKVIDFGLAKATRSSEPGRSALTAAGDLLGTPEYMSPEQTRLDTTIVDTRSDVYSLGVMLFELLTGELPIPRDELRAAGYTELERVLRDTRPPRPSTRWAKVRERAHDLASERRATSTALCRELRGDLDRIVLKTLQKDVEHRYDSAAALADDLKRFLRHEPVLATPPSRRYLLAKFLRRHRVVAAAVAGVALALAGGIVVSTVQMRRADAEARLATASVLVAFDAIDRMLSRLGERELQDVPQAGPIRRAVLEDALTLHRELLAMDREDAPAREQVAASWTRVGAIRHELGDLDGAVEARRTAVRDYAVLCAAQPDRAELWSKAGYTHQELGMALADLDRPDEAMAEYTAARACLDQALRLEPQNRKLAISRAGVLHSVAVVHGRRGERELALQHDQEAFDLLQGLVGDADPAPLRYELAYQGQQLSYRLLRNERLADAEAVQRRSIAVLEQLTAEAPRSRDYRRRLAIGQSHLGVLLERLDRQDEALAVGRAALATRRQLAEEFPSMPDLQHDLGGSLNNVAMLLRAGGDPAEALVMLDEAITAQRAALAAVPQHPNYRSFLRIHYQQATWALRDLGRHRELAARADELAEMAESAAEHLDAADRLAWCVDLAKGDDSSDDAEREALRDRYGARAVEVLRAAMQAGLSQDQLRRPALRSLRGRADFRSLAADRSK